MPRFLRLLRLGLTLGLIAIALGGITLGVLYWLVAPRLPDVQALRNVELQVPMSVYTRDGKLMAQFGETRRYPVTIEKVPTALKQAFIAIEDARFYKHHGLDWRGISRAVWLLATTDDERVPGGSTITQQVARGFYLSSEYSYSRKFMEMLLALKMERELSKDKILELYLNKSFFGNRAYGVAAAAEYYYGKSLDRLTLAESAMLASIPKFPSSGNPLANPARAMTRRNYVLQRMHELHFIDATAMHAGQAEPDRASPHEPPVVVEAPYVAEMVRAEMVARYGGDVLNDGYHVYTTLDSAAQTAAVASVRSGLLAYDQRHGWRGAEAHIDLAADATPATLAAQLHDYREIGGLQPAIVSAVDGNQATLVFRDGGTASLDATAVRWTGRALPKLMRRGDIVRVVATPAVPGKDGNAGAATWLLAQLPKAQAALVSLAPEDGALRAMVGGFSFGQSKFNRAIQAQRQPGSSFKPFLYAAAFERGFTPISIVLDAPVMFRDRAGNVWRPQNDKGDFAGPMRLREALVQSRNLVSVRLLDAIGVDFARRYIHNFGFPLDSLPPNLSMSLGSASLQPLGIARGYTVFVNGGFRIDPYFIDRVLDRDGVVIGREHPLQACRACPDRLQRETHAIAIVDGFNLGAPAPVAPIAGTGDALREAESFVGPPDRFLAPRAIDERNAFLVTSLMKDVVQRGTGTAAKVLERTDLGGKTGSTNDHRDAWFSGFGGDLVTTVWVGKDDFSSLGYREYGGRAALPIWINYMRAALHDVPEKILDVPSGLVTVAVEPGSGAIAPAGTPGTITDYLKTEDLDRITTSGYASELSTSGQEAFDIF